MFSDPFGLILPLLLLQIIFWKKRCLHGNEVTVKNHIIIDKKLANANHVTFFSDHMWRIELLQIQISKGGFATLLVLIAFSLHLSLIFFYEPSTQ